MKAGRAARLILWGLVALLLPATGDAQRRRRRHRPVPPPVESAPAATTAPTSPAAVGAPEPPAATTQVAEPSASATPAPSYAAATRAVGETQAPAALAALHRGPERTGPWAGAGLGMIASTATVPFLRVELGFPLGLSEAPGLRVVVPVLVSYLSISVSALGLTTETRTMTVLPLPAVQYEFLLRVRAPGRLAIVAELGLGPSFGWVWMKMPDQPYTPAHWQSSSAVSFVGHVAGWIQYRFASGLILAAQPIGIFFAQNPGFEAALSVAYQMP